MSGFKVSTDDLLALAAVMRSLTQELTAAGTTPSCGGVENPRVEDRLHSFFSDWSEGLGKIESNLAQIEQRLSAAGHSYEGTDNSIAQALTPHGESR